MKVEEQSDYKKVLYEAYNMLQAATILCSD